MIYHDRSDVVTRSSELHDVCQIKDQIRRADRDEIWASHHSTPERSLLVGYLASSLCMTIEHKGVPIAMLGSMQVSADYPEVGSVWLLGTDGIRNIRTSFLRSSAPVIEIMLERFPVLYNYVDARNTISLDWLNWCGASIGAPQPYGIERLPFHRFEFRRRNKSCAVQQSPRA